MRLVAGSAALEADGTMFKGERPALIAVALETAGFIRSKGLHHRRPDVSVGVVAVDATHRTFGQFVTERLLKLRPDPLVATGALGVDR